MSKRIKINFNSINGGNFEIIPRELIEQSNKRISKAMRKAPTTADEIRECIEQSETLIRLENLTIESLKARLIAMGEPEKRPKLGEVDMLFCQTKEIMIGDATRSDL